MSGAKRCRQEDDAGNVKAKRSIEIHAPGRVKGDLQTPSLQVDKGVSYGTA